MRTWQWCTLGFVVGLGLTALFLAGATPAWAGDCGEPPGDPFLIVHGTFPKFDGHVTSTSIVPLGHTSCPKSGGHVDHVTFDGFFGAGTTADVDLLIQDAAGHTLLDFFSCDDPCNPGSTPSHWGPQTFFNCGETNCDILGDQDIFLKAQVFGSGDLHLSPTTIDLFIPCGLPGQPSCGRVPEPSAPLLLGSALVALGWQARKRST